MQALISIVLDEMRQLAINYTGELQINENYYFNTKI